MDGLEDLSFGLDSPRGGGLVEGLPARSGPKAMLAASFSRMDKPSAQHVGAPAQERSVGFAGDAPLVPPETPQSVANGGKIEEAAPKVQSHIVGGASHFLA
jgi:hypothetical protein